MKNISPCQNGQLVIFTGCDARVAAAVKLFAERWEPFSARFRQHSIFRLLAETIDPAWSDYISSLPVKDIRHVLGKKVIISVLARRRGFLFVSKRLRNLVRLVKRERIRNAKESGAIIEYRSGRHSLSIEDVMDGHQTLEPSYSDIIFNQTVSTLRGVVDDCEYKLPRKTKLDELNARRRREYCELCGEPTELALVLDRKELQEEYGDNARFSSRYCPKHRSSRHDKEWSSSYQSAKRNRAMFDSLVDRLKLHAVNVDSFSFPKSKDVASRFLWQLGRNQDFVSLDTKHIRKLARELVDCKYTECKAWIVIGSESGSSQSEIARRLGITRQAVSKFMATDSFRQLTAIYRRSC